MYTTSERLPHSALGMLQHKTRVERLIASRGADWRLYDTTHRREVALPSSPTAWGMVNLASYLDASTTAILHPPMKSAPFRPQERKFRSPKIKGTCYEYNSKGSCKQGDSCPYRHVCSICSSKQHLAPSCGKFKAPPNANLGPRAGARASGIPGGR